MANYLDFSADVFGVGSDVDALAKQVNENAAGRCTYFDDSSDRISTDFANHSVKRAAKFRELKKVDQQLERLNEKRKELRRELDQLDAERQIMLENAGRPNALSDHEKLLMARAYEKSAYEVEEFATLYYSQPTKEIRDALGKGEERDANPVFFKTILRVSTNRMSSRREPIALAREILETYLLRLLIKNLTADIRTYIKKDESGVERLDGYVKHPDGFPIEAYLVVCSRLKKRTDKLVFTLREQWPLEVIEQTYNGLPCVQAAREAKRETLGKRDLKREDKFEIVGEVLRDMPRETVTAQTVEIMERFKKKNLGKSWKTAERALTKYREEVGTRKPCSVMLS